MIRKIHQQYGHIGTKTMIEMLNKHYYFRNLEKLVKSHCESCRVCIKNKSRTKKTLGFLGKLGPADKPFRIMSLDTVGGFAGNNSTKKYLHILTDHATKFAWIETSRTQSAKDFINLINQVAKKNEIGLILFDQYTGINSKELRKYLKEREIKFLFSPVNHPSSNGNVERLGQTLVNRIRCKFNDGNQKKTMVGLSNRMCGRIQ